MATKRKPKHLHKKAGRPAKITPDVLAKLEEYFRKGLSDEKACFMADIAVDSLYRYIKKHPEFRDRKEALKARPDIDAQVKIVDSIKENVAVAQWWITKRVPEFKDTVKVEGNITHEHTMSPALQAAVTAYNQTRRLEIINNIKQLPS